MQDLFAPIEDCPGTVGPPVGSFQAFKDARKQRKAPKPGNAPKEAELPEPSPATDAAAFTEDDIPW